MILLVILNFQGYKEGGGSLVYRKTFGRPLIGQEGGGSRDSGQLAVNWDES